ncbi:hypothetical protein [Paracoccus jeotgali]|uniref:hypothetical protein n=1 Tax=Paracoccus jeotgali TaxID=2065379 RepID=UPI0028ADBEF1|nr:hypothetical protein [Paracoccus jeotgali]
MSDEQNQTNYDIVRQRFAERQEAKRKFCQENNSFVKMVAHGFRDFMEMPKTYDHMEDGTTTSRSYVPLYSLEDDGSFTERTDWGEAIGHYSNGDFDFGLGIVLEPKPDAYPKQVVRVKVECSRKPDTVEVTIDGETVTCTFDGMESPDVSKVHDLLYELLNKWLMSRWGEPDPKRSIGFHLG